MAKETKTKRQLSAAGKFAVIDIKTGERLTGYDYDRIITSYGGPQIAIKAEDVVDENGNHLAGQGKITYSAIVYDTAEIKEVEGFTLGYRGGFNNGVCIAYNEKEKLHYLINAKGKVLSAGYKMLFPIDYNNIFGLYKNFDRNKNGKYSDMTVIFENGKVVEYQTKEIDFATEYHNFLNTVRFYELTDIQKAVSAIKKYGVNVIELLPNEIFKSAENYLEILFAANEFVVKNNRTVSELLFTIGILSNLLSEFNPTAAGPIKELVLPKKIAGENESQQALMAENITKFHQLLSLSI